MFLTILLTALITILVYSFIGFVVSISDWSNNQKVKSLLIMPFKSVLWIFAYIPTRIILWNENIYFPKDGHKIKMKIKDFVPLWQALISSRKRMTRIANEVAREVLYGEERQKKRIKKVTLKKENELLKKEIAELKGDY